MSQGAGSRPHLAPVAHLAEHPPCKRKAVGSMPTWGSIRQRVA